MGQDTESRDTSYFSNRQADIETAANHIVSSTRLSNRKGMPAIAEIGSEQNSPSGAAETPQNGNKDQTKSSFRIAFSNSKTKPLSEPVVEAFPVKLAANEVVDLPTPKTLGHDGPVSGGDFMPLRKNVNRIASVPFVPLSSDGFKPLRMASKVEPLAAEKPWQEIEVVNPPTVVLSEQEVVRPTPQNTEPSGAAIPSRPAYTVEEKMSQPKVRSVEPQVDTSNSGKQQMSAGPETTSLDHLQMSQRVNSWDRQSTSMRHVTDHFSPGGKPFAYSTAGGNQNFFGVDRRSVCDEWAGVCNCGGGLKDNPGHLGLPWLRSKDACDQAMPLWPHKGRSKSACNSDCGCQTCSD